MVLKAQIIQLSFNLYQYSSCGSNVYFKLKCKIEELKSDSMKVISSTKVDEGLIMFQREV